MNRNHMKSFSIIGVTGGIGTGKSTVSELIRREGARVLDADALSRAATAPGMPALREIQEHFGEEMVNDAGSLDRTRLAEHVFKDPERRKTLEEIIHRHVVDEIDHTIEKYELEGFNGILVLDVPIPVKRGFLDVCDEVWVVEASRDERIARVMKRSGMTENQVKDRMMAQLSDDAYRSLAGRIVENGGTEAMLKEKVVLMVRELHRSCLEGSPCEVTESDDKLDSRPETGQAPVQEESP